MPGSPAAPSRNAQIVDARVRKLAENPSVGGSDASGMSRAFAAICLQTYTGIDEDDAIDCLTDAGNDASIDALHVGDTVGAEFCITVVQAKYTANLAKTDSAFPRNDVVKISTYLTHVFDRDEDLDLPPNLAARVADAKSRIADGEIPRFRVICCNNGKKWDKTAQAIIDGLRDESEWVHVNHDYIVETTKNQAVAKEGKIRLAGSRIVEENDFVRVIVGKVSVAEIKRLFDEFGDALLDRNVRRYLGIASRVNSGIRDSLLTEGGRARFYFLNNGITAICDKFHQSSAVSTGPVVKYTNLQIINGGQTCKTIHQTLAGLSVEQYKDTFVLFRLYDVSGAEDHEELVNRITYATNNQNPVDVGDLRANHESQRTLALSLADLQYVYKTKRDDSSVGPRTITSRVAAEAVLAVWRKKPNAAKFRKTRLFADFFDEIFTSDLNGAQVVIAVSILRAVETERKRQLDGRPQFISYASDFLAMVIGHLLLKELGISLAQLDHRNFPAVSERLEQRRAAYYEDAVEILRKALRKLGVHDSAGLPRLAGQFRRGDLLSHLVKGLSTGGAAGVPISVSKAGRKHGENAGKKFNDTGRKARKKGGKAAGKAPGKATTKNLGKKAAKKIAKRRKKKRT